MKKLTNPRIRKGFSLVELLVVIAIIATLAAASYPAIMGAIRTAKITEGSKMAKDLVFAIEAFEQKYDYLPYPAGTTPGGIVGYTTASAGLLEVLMGEETTPTINPNNVRFFEFQAAKNGVNGIIYAANGTAPSALNDPFGNYFTIYIDYSRERSFDLSDTEFKGQEDNSGTSLVIRSTSAIAGSPGPDADFYDPSNPDLDPDDVKSF